MKSTIRFRQNNREQFSQYCSYQRLPMLEAKLGQYKAEMGPSPQFVCVFTGS